MVVEFKMTDIDSKATRKKVARELQRLSLYWSAVRSVPSITPSYALIPGAPSGFNSKVENAAVKNVDQEREREEFVTRMMDCINRLNDTQRQIIIMEYIESEYRFNYEIWNKIGMSESQYYKVKIQAFYRLAFMLGIEVYKGDERR